MDKNDAKFLRDELIGNMNAANKEYNQLSHALQKCEGNPDEVRDLIGRYRVLRGILVSNTEEYDRLLHDLEYNARVAVRSSAN